jgi:hypothetical protein
LVFVLLGVKGVWGVKVGLRAIGCEMKSIRGQGAILLFILF